MIEDLGKKIIYSAENVKKLHIIMKKAGVNHLSHNDSIDSILLEDEDEEEEEKDRWDKIIKWMEEAEEGVRWIDIFSRQEFFLTLEDTIRCLSNRK